MSAIDKHDFFGVEGDDWCTTCLLPPDDPIHQVDPTDDLDIEEPL